MFKDAPKLPLSTALLLLAATFLFPSTMQAQQQALRFENSKARWTGRLSQGATLKIRSARGDIRFRRVEGPQAKVLVENESRTPKIDVQFSRLPDGSVTFCALTSSGRFSALDEECDPGEERAGPGEEVTFTVEVPKDVRFYGRTETGDIFEADEDEGWPDDSENAGSASVKLGPNTGDGGSAPR